MNLIEIFNSLSLPVNDSKVLNSSLIPEFPSIRIAKDSLGFCVLLFSFSHYPLDIPIKNFRFKYLKIEHNIECKIFSNESVFTGNYSIVTFSSPNRKLQEFFLSISEVLIKEVGNTNSFRQLTQSLNHFIEIFRTVNNSPLKTIQGLWSELFIIAYSKNPKTLIEFWHNKPEEKFDFNSGNQKIEVKSNSNFERKHFFSIEQLNPPINTDLLIASLFLRVSKNGISILDLIDKIKSNIGNENITKVISIVTKTLGTSLVEALEVKYDFEIALNSLRFYSYEDINRIDLNDVPKYVSSVRFIVDISMVQPINLAKFNIGKHLFSSL